VIALAQQFARKFRQTLAPKKASTLTRAERVALRDEIVQGMTTQLESDGTKPTPAIVGLPNSLAGLTDELKAPSEKSTSDGSLGKSFGEVEAICTHCHKANAVAKNRDVIDKYGLQKVHCAHCSKSWEENLSDATLAKSAGSTDLATLRVQVRSQIDELLKRITGLIEERKTASRPAKFQTGGVEKSATAAQELKKALANSKPVTFQSSEAVCAGCCYLTDGLGKEEGS
jgi:hypothetical protein